MRLNLISILVLDDDDGYHYAFGDGILNCTKGTLVVAKGVNKTLFIGLLQNLCAPQVNVIEDCPTVLWY